MDTEPVYVIGVVSRMLAMHPQTLRKYERVGLVQPSRTDGMLRMYSDADVRQLRLIKHLVDDMGLNLAGVELVLTMHRRLESIRTRLAEAGEERAIVLDGQLEELLELLEEGEGIQ
jgi:MerR family transcriptional regulator, heat shock protein HspR